LGFIPIWEPTYTPPSDNDTQDTDDDVDVKRLIKTRDKSNTSNPPPPAPNITVIKTEYSKEDEDDGRSIAGKKITPKETKKPAATVTTPLPPPGRSYAPKGRGANPVVAVGRRCPQHQGRPN